MRVRHRFSLVTEGIYNLSSLALEYHFTLSVYPELQIDMQMGHIEFNWKIPIESSPNQ